MKRLLQMVWAASLLLVVMLSPTEAVELMVERDDQAGTISVIRAGQSEAIVTQNIRPDFRPHIHPIVAPDGKGVLTESSPDHHRHQTGLYWGFTRVNGRDFFHHPEGDHWQRVSADVLEAVGEEVRWRTTYNMLDSTGDVMMVETQTWSMRETDGAYLLQLEWQGAAQTDITIGKYDYGGLFLRMPWREGIEGDVVNAVRQHGARAEGQRSPWVDVGMRVEGRDDLAHIAIFDHGKNEAYPQPWRVDGQLGMGPARSRLGDWKIKAGETETIRHGVYVYTGKLNDLELTEKWKAYSGQGGTYALWNIAQKEGRTAKFLSPQQAVDAMTLADGFSANAWAGEPMLTQPMAFCWDDRGRIWIAENRDYETRGSGFSNFGDSRILILEDTDRDGVADSRKVFCEGIPFPSAVAVGFGGLWLGAPPNLLFIPDKNGDDRGDMDAIEVRLTGWGIRDRHETLNSFHWGPDGWLYGCQGFATPSQVGKPAGAGRIYRHKEAFPEDIEFAGDPVDINGGVFRYHPVKDRFEVVAHGFSNPWGIDYDAKGQFFISACVIPHLWHVIPGGIYHRQGGRHFNPYVYNDIKTIADHRHRSAHGGARIYLADAFPKTYHDRIFMANIHEHAVLTDILEPSGSGFIGKHGDDFMLANNAQWIGFSMEIGPDGNVYVLDWHDADICGKEVLNKDTGRIFRLAPNKSHAESWELRYADLTQQTDEHLVALQKSKSAWHARRARLILQQRASEARLQPSTHAGLNAILSLSNNADHRLRAIWALHVTGGVNETRLQELLHDKDEHVRGWAIQLLCEDNLPPATAIARFINMASDDASPVVRRYLASALQRIPNDNAKWSIAERLASHAEDADDHNLPKLIWFGVEPLVPTAPEQAIAFAKASQIPILKRYTARRLADADMLNPLVAAIGEHTHLQLPFLQGALDALDGRFDLQPPTQWSSVYARLDTSGDVGRLATALAQQFGDTEAAKALLATLRNDKADLRDRRDALRGLAGRQREELKETLVVLLNDTDLRRDAIRAVAAFDDKQLGEQLLSRYADFSADEKLDVVQTLASRSGLGWQLTQAIANKAVPRRDVPAYVARQLRRVVGNGFVEVWGAIDGLNADKEAAFTKYDQLISTKALASANAGRGRAVFKRTCYSCHKLFGDGGAVGPDITGANRGNLEYLMGNILTPSAVIQDAYKMTIVLTHEGRTYSGIVVGENDRQLQLQVANEPEPIAIAKSIIESREVAAVSMMPDGLLTNLQDQEVIDLIAYLQSETQVPIED